MLWKEKAHKGGNLKRLIEGTGFGHGMVDLVRSVTSPILVKPRTLYLINDDSQEARLLAGSEEYIDTAMEVTTPLISRRDIQAEWMSLFECSFFESMPFVDLLFVLQVAKGSEEDLRILHYVLYKRGRAGKPTAVDDLAPIEGAAKFFRDIIDLDEA